MVTSGPLPRGTSKSDCDPVLQIATGMYFSQAELHETTYRRVAYTNASTFVVRDLELPIGVLKFHSSHSDPIAAVTVEVVNKLPKNDPDGSSSFVVSMGDDEQLDDAITVAAFALNVTATFDVDRIRRLVHAEGQRRHRPARLLRRVYDPTVLITDDDVAALYTFCTQLLALDRQHFEAVMRGIRRVVDARLLVSEDPALAYSLFVAALESLSKDTTVPVVTWDEYTSKKAAVIDAACDGLEPEHANRVRDAVLAVDQRTINRRFQAFVQQHVEPSYFREEAADVTWPIRRVDLRRALKYAYEVRSRGLHELRDLEPEAWLASDREDTAHVDNQTVLSLEGMNRLCSHVIRRYVERAPTGIDPSFDYRSRLPGQVRVRLAPQYWAGTVSNLHKDQGPSVLEAMVDMLIQQLTTGEGLVDMSTTLEAIERLLPATSRSADRLSLIATYVLWNRLLPERHRRARQVDFERYAADLDVPGVESFVVHVLLGRDLKWSDDELEQLADDRHEALELGSGPRQGLPARVDAALQVAAARRAWDNDQTRALVHLSRAVELVPGAPDLLAIERCATQGEAPDIDPLDVITWQLEPAVTETVGEPAEASTPDTTTSGDSI